MIKNQRQYRITKAQFDSLNGALARLSESMDTKSAVEERELCELQADALRSQIDELAGEIAQYEGLCSGKVTVLELHSLEELPQALIQARISAGLSQKELADRLGLKEQQIQKYESTGYESSSISRIKKVIEALGLRIREEVFLPTARLSVTDISKRLQKIGIDGALLARLLPRSLTDEFEEKGSESGGWVLQMLASLSRIFGWSPAAVVSGTELGVSTQALGTARLKTYSGTKRDRLVAYAVYAHYLALLVLQATSGLPQKEVPRDPQKLYDEILSKHGVFNLTSVLTYLWESGIPVLPLNDAGAFHGACWRVEGRNVIVLKQRTNSESRWLFDLLHELFHASSEPEERNRDFVEFGEDWEDARDDAEETDASQFAGDVMLDGRSEELAQLCVQAAGKKVERLKAVVPTVAKRENVPIEALANYMAFRLSLQGINWWGAAANLQASIEPPFETARDFFLRRVKLNMINEFDRELLYRAMASEERETGKWTQEGEPRDLSRST